MKALVIGLSGADPDVLFEDERLTHLRRLMEGGCYGRLESVMPPTAVPAWLCMASSMDPGSLGVYGSRGRRDRSYDESMPADTPQVPPHTIWDEFGRHGKCTTLVGVPPALPVSSPNGVRVGCQTDAGKMNILSTHPPELQAELAALVGDCPFDVPGFRTTDKDRLKDAVYAMTSKHFTVVRHLLQHTAWDYFQFVEIGLDRLQHGLWRFHDPQHPRHEPRSPYAEVIRDYYVYLDTEIGGMLELLDAETAIAVLSDHGAQPLLGGFCVNQWLVEQGLLVLNEYPATVTPFNHLDVNWQKTTAWSDGGHCAHVFLNVKGREPTGLVEPADFEVVRQEIKSRLAGIVDDSGRSQEARAFIPTEIYRAARDIAPDLIVTFANLGRRATTSVGHPTLSVQQDDAGPDDCGHTIEGTFILAAGNNPLRGEVRGAHILDVAPTLLEICQREIPTSMQGRSLVAGKSADPAATSLVSDEDLIRQRLRGLGYIE